MTDGFTTDDLKAGLERVALDLHIHSPASRDWRDGDVTAEDLVRQALDQGLNGIAITDHESGQFIDRLRAAAEGTGLTIIPGVELNNLAGNEGIHLIALFDLDMTANDVDHFLSSIGSLKGTGAKVTRGTATAGILEVLEAIEERGGIAVLAHCQSSKGSLAEMRGDVRTMLVRHPVVLAAEARAEEHYDETKKATGKRTWDWLDGTDPTYKRKLAVYQASDNPAPDGHGHSLAGIGSRFSYFYVERPITMESLRQCFIDREVRIEYPEVGASIAPAAHRTVPRITKVEVTGGFLDGLALDLHEGLTTILGSKGSGKSVLIELIRFALDQASDQPEIRKDHETKLKKQLGVYGTVAVTIDDSGGTTHRLVRTYDPANDSPITDVTFDPAEFFPCHFLSQNEIIRLAESESEQIKFIDSFFDFHAFQRDIEAARSELMRLDTDVAEQIRAGRRIIALQTQAETLKAQIAEKDKALVSPIFSKFRESQAKKQALDRHLETLDGMIAAATTGRDTLAATPMAGDPAASLASDQLLRQLADKLKAAHQKALALSSEALDVLGASRSEAIQVRAEWLKEFKGLSDKYTEEIRKMGGDAPALNQERARLVTALDTAEKELLARRQLAERLRPTAERRQAVLDTLEQRRAEYTEARRRRCAWFEDKSDGQIQASVEAGSNYDEFCERLSQMKRGSYLTGDEVEAVASGIGPRKFVSAILNYDHTRDANQLQNLATATGLVLDKVRVLADFLLGEQEYEQLLALAYTATPTDRPEIRFRRPGGSYAPLAELSTGQKATAFLVMTLCEGDTPVIVDQPEDSLDIRSIWDDMCLRLRRSKRSRQFIFTTHNSSLAVASDSDKFVVLKADAHRAEVAMAGAIDGEHVRRHVIDLLEGGADTYFLKQRKYNVTDISHD
jgi:ABC-type enterochelin transport system ATPase subunit/histidinol phosphatase-like PHP family hydrolase